MSRERLLFIAAIITVLLLIILVLVFVHPSKPSGWTDEQYDSWKAQSQAHETKIAKLTKPYLGDKEDIFMESVNKILVDCMPFHLSYVEMHSAKNGDWDNKIKGVFNKCLTQVPKNAQALLKTIFEPEHAHGGGLVATPHNSSSPTGPSAKPSPSTPASNNAYVEQLKKQAELYKQELDATTAQQKAHAKVQSTKNASDVAKKTNDAAQKQKQQAQQKLATAKKVEQQAHTVVKNIIQQQQQSAAQAQQAQEQAAQQAAMAKKAAEQAAMAKKAVEQAAAAKKAAEQVAMAKRAAEQVAAKATAEREQKEVEAKEASAKAAATEKAAQQTAAEKIAAEHNQMQTFSTSAQNALSTLSTLENTVTQQSNVISGYLQSMRSQYQQLTSLTQQISNAAISGTGMTSAINNEEQLQGYHQMMVGVYNKAQSVVDQLENVEGDATDTLQTVSSAVGNAKSVAGTNPSGSVAGSIQSIEGMLGNAKNTDTKIDAEFQMIQQNYQEIGNIQANAASEIISASHNIQTIKNKLAQPKVLPQGCYPRTNPELQYRNSGGCNYDENSCRSVSNQNACQWENGEGQVIAGVTGLGSGCYPIGSTQKDANPCNYGQQDCIKEYANGVGVCHWVG